LPASFINRAFNQRLFWLVAVVFIVPLAVFVGWALLQGPAGGKVVRLQTAEVWIEPLGSAPFNDATLQHITDTQPDWTQAQWQSVDMPHSVRLPASIDLPDNAPKQRVWFKFRPPAANLQDGPNHERWALMVNRVMGSAWAVYANGELVQSNLADRSIQWNAPVQVLLPATLTPQKAPEILLAVPYQAAKGFAVGSVFVGNASAIDAAWKTRHFYQLDLPRAATCTAFLLCVLCLHLVWNRRGDHLFALLAANMVTWAMLNVQWFVGFEGHMLSKWFGFAMDISITWSVVFELLFVYEFLWMRSTRVRLALLMFGVVSTLVTLPVWRWNMFAMIAQHYVTICVHLGCLATIANQVRRHPSREGYAMLVVMLLQAALGFHDIFVLSGHRNPDHYFMYPHGVLMLVMVFSYVTIRRSLQAFASARAAQSSLQATLSKQQDDIEKQDAAMHQLEIAHQLSRQHELLMQDLHDGFGSNLTSALLQARNGSLSHQDTVLLLQDLTDELRNLGRANWHLKRTINETLSDLRQRVTPRLSAGGIALVWDVAPRLPDFTADVPEAAHHLRAILSEAIANTIKHANATQIVVQAQSTADGVCIVVTDNGQGFDAQSVSTGRGMPGMQRRAAAIGARFDVLSPAGSGTSITVAI
jgi:signal transduction histidine kinase